MRILIVDDNVDLADVLATALRAEGAHVEVVTRNFGQLRDPGRWSTIDAAIVDLNLPGDLHGGRILNWLAANAPHVRRVAFTAIPKDIAASDLACDAYLEKPASARELLAAVGFFPLAPVPRTRWRLRDPASAGLVWLAALYSIGVIMSVLAQARDVAAGAHLAAFAGCLFVAVFFSPHIRTSLTATKVTSTMFFGSAAVSHLMHFFRVINGLSLDYTSRPHSIVVMTQAISVIGMTVSLWFEFVHREGHWPPHFKIDRKR